MDRRYWKRTSIDNWRRRASEDLKDLYEKTREVIDKKIEKRRSRGASLKPTEIDSELERTKAGTERLDDSSMSSSSQQSQLSPRTSNSLKRPAPQPPNVSDSNPSKSNLDDLFNKFSWACERRKLKQQLLSEKPSMDNNRKCERVIDTHPSEMRSVEFSCKDLKRPDTSGQDYLRENPRTSLRVIYCDRQQPTVPSKQDLNELFRKFAAVRERRQRQSLKCAYRRDLQEMFDKFAASCQRKEHDRAASLAFKDELHALFDKFAVQQRRRRSDVPKVSQSDLKKLCGKFNRVQQQRQELQSATSYLEQLLNRLVVESCAGERHRLANHSEATIAAAQHEPPGERCDKLMKWSCKKVKSSFPIDFKEKHESKDGKPVESEQKESKANEAPPNLKENDRPRTPEKHTRASRTLASPPPPAQRHIELEAKSYMFEQREDNRSWRCDNSVIVEKGEKFAVPDERDHSQILEPNKHHKRPILTVPITPRLTEFDSGLDVVHY